MSEVCTCKQEINLCGFCERDLRSRLAAAESEVTQLRLDEASWFAKANAAEARLAAAESEVSYERSRVEVAFRERAEAESRLAAAERERDEALKRASVAKGACAYEASRASRLEAALRALVEIQPASEAWPNYKRTVLAEARAALAEGDHE